MSDSSKLITVTGEIAASAVTLADCHSHAWIAPVVGGASDAPVLDDYAAIRDELLAFRAVGGSLIVDCQPGGCGRDVRQLAALSRATGLAITSVTGFHLRKYYPQDRWADGSTDSDGAWLWAASTDAAAAHFIRELTEGVAESDYSIPATLIKIGYSGTIEGQSQRLMEAVGIAAKATGAAILFHTEAGANIEALVPFFEARGVPPTRLYLCHVDKRPDFSLHRDLIQAGVLLGYDTFLRPKYDPDNNVWKLIPALVDAGLAHGLALGIDPAFATLWAFGGGAGPRALAEQVQPRLRQMGIEAASIALMMGQSVVSRMVRVDPIR